MNEYKMKNMSIAVAVPAEILGIILPLILNNNLFH